MNYIEGQPRYLKIDKVIDFIDKISNVNLEHQMILIKKREWQRAISKYKRLERKE